MAPACCTPPLFGRSLRGFSHTSTRGHAGPRQGEPRNDRSQPGFRVTEVDDVQLDEITAIDASSSPGSSVRSPQRFRTVTSDAEPARAGHRRLGRRRRPRRPRGRQAFHVKLLSYSGNSRLVELVSDLRGQTRLLGLVSLLENGSSPSRRPNTSRSELLHLATPLPSRRSWVTTLIRFVAAGPAQPSPPKPDSILVPRQTTSGSSPFGSASALAAGGLTAVNSRSRSANSPARPRAERPLGDRSLIRRRAGAAAASLAVAKPHTGPGTSPSRSGSSASPFGRRGRQAHPARDRSAVGDLLAAADHRVLRSHSCQ